MHATLSDQVLDLVQNGVEAGGTRVELDYADSGDGWVRVRVKDDGRGMDTETRVNASDPFRTDGMKHPARKTGFGLAFLSQLCETCGGSFSIDSEPGAGTTLNLALPKGHPDFPPEGDLALLFRDCLLLSGDREISIRRTAKGGEYLLSKRELEEAIGRLHDAEAPALLLRYLRSLETDSL